MSMPILIILITNGLILIMNTFKSGWESVRQAMSKNYGEESHSCLKEIIILILIIIMTLHNSRVTSSSSFKQSHS